MKLLKHLNSTPLYPSSLLCSSCITCAIQHQFRNMQCRKMKKAEIRRKNIMGLVPGLNRGPPPKPENFTQSNPKRACYHCTNETAMPPKPIVDLKTFSMIIYVILGVSRIDPML